jgi:hypothetical protein
MGKIKEVVKLKTGYANFVNLKSAYEEDKENADRMAMYRPTKSHRAAFERLCRGLYYRCLTPNGKPLLFDTQLNFSYIPPRTNFNFLLG